MCSLVLVTLDSLHTFSVYLLLWSIGTCNCVAFIDRYIGNYVGFNMTGSVSFWGVYSVDLRSRQSLYNVIILKCNIGQK